MSLNNSEITYSTLFEHYEALLELITKRFQRLITRFKKKKKSKHNYDDVCTVYGLHSCCFLPLSIELYTALLELIKSLQEIIKQTYNF